MKRRISDRIRIPGFLWPSSISLKFDSSHSRYLAHCACVQPADNLALCSRAARGASSESIGLHPMNSMILLAILAVGTCRFSSQPVTESGCTLRFRATCFWVIPRSRRSSRKWSPSVLSSLGYARFLGLLLISLNVQLCHATLPLRLLQSSR